MDCTGIADLFIDICFYKQQEFLQRVKTQKIEILIYKLTLLYKFSSDHDNTKLWNFSLSLGQILVGFDSKKDAKKMLLTYRKGSGLGRFKAPNVCETD